MKIAHILVWNALTKNQKPYIGVEILLKRTSPPAEKHWPSAGYNSLQNLHNRLETAVETAATIAGRGN